MSPPEIIAEVVASYPQSKHVKLVTGAHYPHVINSVEYNAAVATALA